MNEKKMKMLMFTMNSSQKKLPTERNGGNLMTRIEESIVFIDKRNGHEIKDSNIQS